MFRRIVDFKRVTLLADSAIVEAVGHTGRLREFVGNVAAELDILAVGATFDPARDIPMDTEVVVLTPLPQLRHGDQKALIDALTLARIPSFSLAGDDVAEGTLAAEEYEHDWLSVARFNALNMQAALLGEDISKLPVYYTSKSRMVINMTTADRIGVSPPFDVLHEVETIRTEDDLPQIFLPDAVRAAIEYNPKARASELRMLAGEEKVRSARSRLLPQLSLAAVSQQRRENSVLAKANAVQTERTDASLVLEQLVFSEKAWAGLAIERNLQLARSAQHRQAILDTAYNTASAFIKVLQSEAQVRVRMEDLRYSFGNLDIARKRQALGDVGQAEVFRWESELAQARQRLLAANAQWLQAQDNLNVFLHYPVQSRFKLSPPSLEEAGALLTNETVLKAIERPATLRVFSDWLVEVGLEQAPELEAVKAQQQAAQRRYDSARRAYWLPDVSLSAQRMRNYGIEATQVVGENDHDWVVELSARIPLYSGGQRRSELGQARYEREALAYDELSVRDQLEQGIRAQLHAVAASYPSIDYANKAAETATRNYELIEEAYTRGAADISDIIDAQRAQLSAKESAANARFNFLQDYLALQRRVGEIDLSTDTEKRRRLLRGLEAKLK
jgi:outer membrane protein TolC